jgi:hypothetical protein
MEFSGESLTAIVYASDEAMTFTHKKNSNKLLFACDGNVCLYKFEQVY